MSSLISIPKEVRYDLQFGILDPPTRQQRKHNYLLIVMVSGKGNLQNRDGASGIISIKRYRANTLTHKCANAQTH